MLVWSCTRLGVNNQTLSHESRNVRAIFELNATRSCYLYLIASTSIQFIPSLSGDKTGKCFLFWLIWFYWFALTSKELHGITRSDRNRMSQMALSAEVLQIVDWHVRACPARTLPKASRRQDTGRPKVCHFKSLQELRFKIWISVLQKAHGAWISSQLLCFEEFVAPRSQKHENKKTWMLLNLFVSYIEYVECIFRNWRLKQDGVNLC